MLKGKSSTERQAEERRLRMLQALEKAADYQLTSTILHAFLAAVGAGCSAVVIARELGWLEEVGLIMTGQMEGILVARLLQAGKDVAQGLDVMAGIARPGP